MFIDEINQALEALDAAHDETVEEARKLLKELWDEMRRSGEVRFRGATISIKGNGKYVDIYWFKMAYKSHQHGSQEKPFLTRVPKGRGFRYSRKGMGQMDYFTDALFQNYEDKFSVLRELFSKYKSVRRELDRIKVIAKKL